MALKTPLINSVTKRGNETALRILRVVEIAKTYLKSDFRDGHLGRSKKLLCMRDTDTGEVGDKTDTDMFFKNLAKVASAIECGPCGISEADLLRMMRFNKLQRRPDTVRRLRRSGFEWRWYI
jgi:hypothetical protein